MLYYCTYRDKYISVFKCSFWLSANLFESLRARCSCPAMAPKRSSDAAAAVPSAKRSKVDSAKAESKEQDPARAGSKRSVEVTGHAEAPIKKAKVTDQASAKAGAFAIGEQKVDKGASSCAPSGSGTSSKPSTATSGKAKAVPKYPL